jgi:hypothetical protein
MVSWLAQMHRRNSRSWEGMLARMSTECRLQWSATPSAGAEALGAIWTEDPRAAFRDSGVLLEMTDYAERNALSYDSARMEAARTAAFELRAAATRAMIRRISLR